ncbi:glycoside hydrolase family 2 [Mycolicibacterium flavescens]|uniref:glycoside hydrolase family 2 protein n=1 Tax=Mycolicibacterium flavescens TaxID=1776 RepID=UPI000A04646A|nr:sugar-binding domain-containing protein [Mycolicibacterium flavescens]MCV7279282.1 glycoside hydrolase family 2 [Mycolicibacterium flavescens]
MAEVTPRARRRWSALTRAAVAAVAVVAALATVQVPAHAAEAWQRQSAPLSTPWTHLVGPNNALPEYPRPQMARARWLNLNGVWAYTGRSGEDASAAAPSVREYDERILVPYPTESALSGIKRHDDQMWYRKVFELPGTWRGQRVLLHFGAVDQTATVWVNNKKVAHHEGGYTAFSADITDALRWSGSQEIVVRAEDRNEDNPFAVGKQRNEPEGLFYTGASGIWQTVWMEPVRATHIDKLDIASDLTGFTVTPRVTGVTDERAEVIVSTPDGKTLARSSGEPGKPVRVKVPEPRLWTPEDPYLYDLEVKLVSPEGKVVDEVASYGGLRTISTVPDPQGRPRIALNNKITFLHGPLDQGYWPDGIYTAPTDDALRFDLERTKALGMNFVRKHAKVEPARWYHWADKLGLLVWQDMPSLDVSLDIPVGPAPDPSPAAKVNFERELVAMVDQLRSVTSIVGWVPFNEGWGEFDTARIAGVTKRADPTRMVNANSGVNCCKSRPDTRAGDIYDDHTYVGPGRPVLHDNPTTPRDERLNLGDRPVPLEHRVVVDGEYGGLGLVPHGNRWPGKPQAYEMTDSRARLTERYVEVSRDLEDAVRRGGLSGAIYTQTTDVENEVNGYMTYDRWLVKMSLRTVAERNRAVIAAGSVVDPPERRR